MSRPGSRRQHKKFCNAEGWELVRDAQGKPVGHHITYELLLADGRILRTRISRPANNTTYGAALWSTILGPEQLNVSEEEFWACVERGIRPSRPAHIPVIPAHALPADLVYQLLHNLKMSDVEVASLTRQQALDLVTEFWSKPTK